MVKKVMLTDEEFAPLGRQTGGCPYEGCGCLQLRRGCKISTTLLSPPFMPEPVEMTDEELTTARRWSAEWEAARMRALAVNN
jgi:hypothetical protein